MIRLDRVDLNNTDYFTFYVTVTSSISYNATDTPSTAEQIELSDGESIETDLETNAQGRTMPKYFVYRHSNDHQICTIQFSVTDTGGQTVLFGKILKLKFMFFFGFFVFVVCFFCVCVFGCIATHLLFEKCQLYEDRKKYSKNAKKTKQIDTCKWREKKESNLVFFFVSEHSVWCV